MAVHDEDEAFFEGIERSKKDLSVHWHKCKVKSLCISNRCRDEMGKGIALYVESTIYRNLFGRRFWRISSKVKTSIFRDLRTLLRPTTV
jgi:hypothetical protein